MGRRKNVVLNEVEITGIADKGKSVGRHENKVVFVEGAVPGDVVDVNVFKKRKGHMIGKVINFVSYSTDRVNAQCQHFGICGGCKWQNLSYDAQLRHKELTVKNALSRIGKIDISDILPIIGSSETYFYRNKLEFSFSNKRWLTEEEINSEADFGQRNALGFHRPGAFDKIVDVTECHLQPEPSNSIRNKVREFALANNFTFFDLRAQVGLLRQLFIRISSIGEVMVIVSFHENDEVKISLMMNFLKDEFPDITSLLYVINPKKNDTIYDLNIETWNGNKHIVDQLGDVRFKIGPKSFFQTNSRQAKVLYDVVADFADLKGDELVFDLYSGIGSIALYIASQCKKVIGIEEVAPAVDDARENSIFNGIENAEFIAGDVKDIFLNGMLSKLGNPDLVITDPPRAGMHKDVVETLLKMKCPSIVYVSCNPATQARDLEILSLLYEVTGIQPVDMFPHTHHIENVVLLKLR